MHLLHQLHVNVDRCARIPGVRSLIERSYRRAFVANRDKNLFHEVFDSFEAAATAATAYGTVGYDNVASADLYLDMMRVVDHDYPAMFWLARSFKDGTRTVFDVGGSIGIKYYAFAKPLPVPNDVRWTVEDVPVVAQRGRELAVERGVSENLKFTDRFAEGDGSELLFASGSLQYLPRTLAEYLADWKTLPRRIVINTTPIHVQEFFTINSIGTAFCPYRVQNQAKLVRSLGQLGYKMFDQWSNVGKALRLPLRPDLSLDHYRGFCFDLVK